MAEERESMKGKGADIFLGEEPEEESEEETEEKGSGTEENEEVINLNEEVEKEKAGFYVRKDVTEKLEFVWVQARSITGKKVSKSYIVNLALKKLIEKFNEDPEDNFLVNQWKS